ncbi:hypothetical protein [Dactylosporangium sp. CA-092794]|uniref:hypothetical protein n=1 Tax=Dactylosporangium sp. CA-092794 TaxID=3239929 RepID=UPI003D8CECE8
MYRIASRSVFGLGELVRVGVGLEDVAGEGELVHDRGAGPWVGVRADPLENDLLEAIAAGASLPPGEDLQ